MNKNRKTLKMPVRYLMNAVLMVLLFLALSYMTGNMLSTYQNKVLMTVCLGGAQHRAGKHQRHLRVAKILFQRFQLGAALRTQGQVAAAANIQAFQVSLRQAVPD